MDFNLIIEKDDEGFYVSEVVGLPGCEFIGVQKLKI